MTRLDSNKDGYISREDIVLIGKQLSEYNKGQTKEQADAIYKKYLHTADVLELQPGVKMLIDEAAQRISVLSFKTPPAIINEQFNTYFDIIDTDNDGKISVKEFKVYFHILAPALSDEEISHSFNVIDTDKDGIISREEFAATGEDFMVGVEETDLSKVFYGPLID